MSCRPGGWGTGEGRADTSDAVHPRDGQHPPCCIRICWPGPRATCRVQGLGAVICLQCGPPTYFLAGFSFHIACWVFALSTRGRACSQLEPPPIPHPPPLTVSGIGLSQGILENLFLRCCMRHSDSSLPPLAVGLVSPIPHAQVHPTW